METERLVYGSSVDYKNDDLSARLDGTEGMPSALISLYEGTEAGVRMVRVDPDAEERPPS